MYSDEKFGSWQIGNDPERGEVEFKIFFPDRTKDASQYEFQRQLGNALVDLGDPRIESIQVAGDFQTHLGQADWDFNGAPHLSKQPHAKGWVWQYRTGVPLPKGFYQYKYFVTFSEGKTRIVGDPCACYGGCEKQNSGFAIGGSDPVVVPIAGERKHLRDLVVYELMIEDFTDEYRTARAPLDAVADKLEYLSDTLGINAILFMPWTAWPGEGYSWGYTPYQYFSVEYRYANAINKPEEKLSWLATLVNRCHALGIHVIMDGVFNHVGDADPVEGEAYGFPYRWLYEDPFTCPYVGTFGGEFAGLTDLDFHQGCTREFIRDVCFYWMDTFQIDGIRFDNTTNFYIAGEHRGLPQLLEDIAAHAQARGLQNFSLTLEHLNLEASHVTNLTGATSYWNNGLYQCCFDYLWNGQIDSRIMGALQTHAGLDEERVATVYLSNHDHSNLAWQAGARENKGALQWFRTQPYVIALFTCPGSVLIPNGQEFGEDYWLMEDDDGSNRRVKPRPLRWDFVKDKIGSSLLALYAKLAHIRKTCAALRSNNFYPRSWETWQTRFDPQGYGVDVEKQVVVYHRWGTAPDGRGESLMIVLNFSPNHQWINVPFAHNGIWEDLLTGQTVEVFNHQLNNHQIESNWGKIYFQLQ